jgi:putative tryptophan/tyrosine transport system permease protein
VIGGAIIYRIVVTLALRVDFLEPGDMKLITAVIVIIALIMPKTLDRVRESKRKAKRLRTLT